MGTSTASFQAVSKIRHSISTPFFYNFRAEQGKIVMDAGWKKTPLSPEDFQIHLTENISEPMRIKQGRTPTLFPYEFEHYADLPHGKKFSLTLDSLERWLEKAETHPVNKANCHLVQVLTDARDYGVVKALEAGFTVPTVQQKTAMPNRIAVFEIV